eukprot:12890306-Prorocentrum_lima.AAC.1
MYLAGDGMALQPLQLGQRKEGRGRATSRASIGSFRGLHARTYLGYLPHHDLADVVGPSMRSPHVQDLGKPLACSTTFS